MHLKEIWILYDLDVCCDQSPSLRSLVLFSVPFPSWSISFITPYIIITVCVIIHGSCQRPCVCTCMCDDSRRAIIICNSTHFLGASGTPALGSLLVFAAPFNQISSLFTNMPGFRKHSGKWGAGMGAQLDVTNLWNAYLSQPLILRWPRLSAGPITIFTPQVNWQDDWLVHIDSIDAVHRALYSKPFI